MNWDNRRPPSCTSSSLGILWIAVRNRDCHQQSEVTGDNRIYQHLSRRVKLGATSKSYYSFAGVTLQNVGAGEADMRERASDEIHDDGPNFSVVVVIIRREGAPQNGHLKANGRGDPQFNEKLNGRPDPPQVNVEAGGTEVKLGGRPVTSIV